MPKKTPKHTYYKTYLTVDDGQECEYYGKDVKVGDQVEVFFDPKWDVTKAQKPRKA